MSRRRPRPTTNSSKATSSSTSSSTSQSNSTKKSNTIPATRLPLRLPSTMLASNSSATPLLFPRSPDRQGRLLPQSSQHRIDHDLTAPHLAGTVKLPQTTLAGTYDLPDIESSNVDPTPPVVGGPEYVGKSFSVGSNYRREEVPSFQGAKDIASPRLPVFLDGARTTAVGSVPDRSKLFSIYTASTTTTSTHKMSATASATASAASTASTTSHNDNSNASPALYPATSRRRVVSKTEKFQELEQQQLHPLRDRYGQRVGDERIRVHTASFTKHRPHPTRQRNLTTTQASVDSLSVLLSPQRSETMRSHRWMYKRQPHQDGLGMASTMTSSGTVNEESGIMLLDTMGTPNRSTGGLGSLGLGSLGLASTTNQTQRPSSPTTTSLLHVTGAHTDPNYDEINMTNNNEKEAAEEQQQRRQQQQEQRDTRLQFFQYVFQQIDNLIQHAASEKEQCALLSPASVTRILQATGIRNINMALASLVMTEIKHMHRQGDAKARVIYEFRQRFPALELSLPAIAASGMDVFIAQELRRAMDVDALGQLYQQCVAAANKASARRTALWGGNHQRQDMRKMPGRFAFLSFKLLVYEPLPLRLRDLWEGRMQYEGTKSNFLIVQLDDQVDKIQVPFGHALWTTIEDGASFTGRLPMELKEFTTREKRRRTRSRTQLWCVWMPEHAHICEDWAEERWDIIRRAHEIERRLRAKEGFRSLNDEGEKNIDEMSFHHYFQTITRRMHTFVPPHMGNFAPPRWAPDPVAAARAMGVHVPNHVVVPAGGGGGGGGQGSGGGQGTGNDGLELSSAATLNTTLKDVFAPSGAHDIHPYRRNNIPHDWNKAVSAMSLDIREHVTATLQTCRAQTSALIHDLCARSMHSYVGFIEAYDPPVYCKTTKRGSEGDPQNHVQETSESTTTTKNRRTPDKKQHNNKIQKQQHTTKNNTKKTQQHDNSSDTVLNPLSFPVPPPYVSPTDGLGHLQLKPAFQVKLMVFERKANHRNNHPMPSLASPTSSSSSSSASPTTTTCTWSVDISPTLEEIAWEMDKSLTAMAALSVGYISPRVGPRYPQDVETTWSESERNESLVTSMSLQGVPDPNLIAAREEKARVLGAQKDALEAMEKEAASKRNDVIVLSVNDHLSAEDDDTVTGIEMELEDSKYYIIQSHLLKARGLGSPTSEPATAATSSKGQQGHPHNQDNTNDGRPVQSSTIPGLTLQEEKEMFRDTLRNSTFDHEASSTSSTAKASNASGLPPPIFISGMHAKDDPLLHTARQKVRNVFVRTKPWLGALVDSIRPYVEALYDASEEEELHQYLEAFLHETEASSDNATRFDLSLEGITVRIEKYLTLADAITVHCNYIEYLPKGIVVINAEDCKQQLRQKALRLAGVLLNGCKERLLHVCTDLDIEYKKIEHKISQPPCSSLDVFNLRQYSKLIEEVLLPQLNVAFHHPKTGVKKYLLLLQVKFGQNIKFQEDETALVARVYQWPGHLENSVLVLTAGAIDMYAQKQVNLLQLERIDLEKELRATSTGVRAMRKRECRLLDASMLPKIGVGVQEIVPVPQGEDDNGPDPRLLAGWQSHVDSTGPSSIGGAVIRADTLRADLTKLAKDSLEIMEEEIRLGQPSSDYGHQVNALSKALNVYEGAWGDLQLYIQARTRVYGFQVTTIDAAQEIHLWNVLRTKLQKWLQHEKLRDAVSVVGGGGGGVCFFVCFLLLLLFLGVSWCWCFWGKVAEQCCLLVRVVDFSGTFEIGHERSIG